MVNKRPEVIVGNWKMYKTIEESVDFIEKLTPLVSESEPFVYLAAPFTALQATSKASEGTKIVVGAQNMNDATEGAFTGEVAASMLLDVGAKFVILGHSERRQLFGETSSFVNKKVKRSLAEGLKPIVCVGETLEERESGKTEEIVMQQISESLEGISTEELEKILIAYEPVWAIGTGRTATPKEAQEVHAFQRHHIGEVWGKVAADKIGILYGGSVKPANARELMQQNDIDGLLVGGASLSPESFGSIINYQNALTH